MGKSNTADDRGLAREHDGHSSGDRMRRLDMVEHDTGMSYLTMLVEGFRQPGPADPRLAYIAGNLRRHLEKRSNFFAQCSSTCDPRFERELVEMRRDLWWGMCAMEAVETTVGQLITETSARRSKTDQLRNMLIAIRRMLLDIRARELDVEMRHFWEDLGGDG